MPITRLAITNVRNISSIETSPSHAFNIIYGLNGSGKTSLLESIYILSTGKSFKTKQNERIIKNTHPNFNIFAEYAVDNFNNSIGIQKNIDGTRKIQINNSKPASIIQLASIMPTQIITTDSYKIFHDGPKARRQFIDKGLFHVDPSFMGHWRSYQKALKQRNTAIRMKLRKSEISTWDPTLTSEGIKVSKLRESYIHSLEPLINRLSTELLKDIPKISIRLDSGWEKNELFEDILARNIYSDIKAGFTKQGPHRCDLIITSGNETPIKDFLSQGQQKLLAYIINIAQSLLLEEITKKKSVYLIDDLPSELDSISIQNIVCLLNKISGQFFITAIDKNMIEGLIPNEKTQLFHMKHGAIED
jgi:DNA replication and repair protein RecF